MPSLSMIAKSALLAAVLATPAASAVVVPGSGTTDYRFVWDGGIGQIDGIGPVDQFPSPRETEWSLTLATASTVSFTATDRFLRGDAFELLLGGLVKPWTTTALPDGYFQGNFLAPLAAGSYLFSLRVSRIAQEITDGEGVASFTVTPTVVPLPAAGWLLIGALGGLVALRRRKSV